MFKILKNLIFYLALFIIFDIFYSNFLYKESIKYNCYKYLKNFHELQKNCKAKEKWIRSAKSYDVFTDKNGFRYSGKDIKSKNQSVIFLGDSFTYGMGLDYYKTFTGIIEKKILNYDIKNLGVQGYSSSVYLYQIRNYIKKDKNLKKIIIQLDISDVFEEASIWTKDKQFIHPVLIKERKNELEINDFDSFKEKNFKGSRLIARSINNFFRNLRIEKSKKDRKNLKPGFSGWGNFLFLDIKKTNPVLWEPIGFNNALKKIENDFVQIGKIIKDNNLELYILTYPWPDTLEYGQNSFNWEKFSNSLCIKSECSNLINLFPDFQKIKNNNNNWLYKIYIDGDLHITHFGHKIIAEKIINKVFLNE